MGSLDKLHKAINILMKYEGMEKESCSAEHDELCLPLPKDLSEDDIEKLEELCCIDYDEEYITFFT